MIQPRMSLLALVPALLVLGVPSVQSQWGPCGVGVGYTYNSPDIASDGLGGAWCAGITYWVPDPSFNNCVVVGHVTCAGTLWNEKEGVMVVGGNAYLDDASIIADGTGGAIAFWPSQRYGGAIMAQRVTPNWTIAPGWPNGGIALSDSTYFSDFDWGSHVGLASDGTGGAYVTWTRRIDLSAPGDIYVQRVLASGAVAPGWPGGGLLACGAIGDQHDAVAVVDGAGGVIVAWVDLRSAPDGTPYDSLYKFRDIYAVRLDGNGARVAGWQPNGSPVITGHLGQRDVCMAADGVGGAFVGWTDMRVAFNTDDIYAQHILGDGALAWPQEGAPVCRATASQHLAGIIADGFGGTVLTWHDYRYGDCDVFVQRLTSLGIPAPGWADNGVALCENLAEQWLSGSCIVSDGSGGAIVAWSDARLAAGRTPYAQRITANGVVAWQTDGVCLCPEPGVWSGVDLCSDLAGGAIACGMYDDWDIIVTQRIGGDGTVAPTTTVEQRLPSRLEVGQAWPNPTRRGASLSLALAESRTVRVDVFDVTGRHVATPFDTRTLPAGAQTVAWDGCAADGIRAPTGLYFIRVTTGDFAASRKVFIVN